MVESHNDFGIGRREILRRIDSIGGTPRVNRLLEVFLDATVQDVRRASRVAPTDNALVGDPELAFAGQDGAAGPPAVGARTPLRERSIDHLIELLNARRFVEREQASRELERRGLDALPALRVAAASGSGEVSRRAQALVRRIESHIPLDTLAALQQMPVPVRERIQTLLSEQRLSRLSDGEREELRLFGRRTETVAIANLADLAHREGPGAINTPRGQELLRLIPSIGTERPLDLFATDMHTAMERMPVRVRERLQTLLSQERLGRLSDSEREELRLAGSHTAMLAMSNLVELVRRDGEGALNSERGRTLIGAIRSVGGDASPALFAASDGADVPPVLRRFADREISTLYAGLQRGGTLRDIRGTVRRAWR
jgi:hypothetical protein